MQPRLLVRAATSADDHTLRVWDLEGNQPPRVLEDDAIRASAWRFRAMVSAPSPARKTTLCGSGIWSLATAWRYSPVTTKSSPAPGPGSGLWPETAAAKAILNTGTSNWTTWTMTWNFANGQKITAGSFYGGTETHTVTSVSVPPAGSYDGVVNAGSSTPSGDLGFQATWPGGTNAVPAISINGTACTSISTIRSAPSACRQTPWAR